MRGLIMKKCIGIIILLSPFIALTCACVWTGRGSTGWAGIWGALAVTFGIPLIIVTLIISGVYLITK
jgi:hypothetical protein